MRGPVADLENAIEVEAVGAEKEDWLSVIALAEERAVTFVGKVLDWQMRIVRGASPEAATFAGDRIQGASLVGVSVFELRRGNRRGWTPLVEVREFVLRRGNRLGWEAVDWSVAVVCCHAGIAGRVEIQALAAEGLVGLPVEALVEDAGVPVVGDVATLEALDRCRTASHRVAGRQRHQEQRQGHGSPHSANY